MKSESGPRWPVDMASDTFYVISYLGKVSRTVQTTSVHRVTHFYQLFAFAHSPFSVLCLQNQLRVSWRLPSIYSAGFAVYFLRAQAVSLKRCSPDTVLFSLL